MTTCPSNENTQHTDSRRGDLVPYELGPPDKRGNSAALWPEPLLGSVPGHSPGPPPESTPRTYGKTRWGDLKTLSPIDEAWVRENWNALTLTDICKHLHVAPNTLAKLVEPLGLPRKRRPSKYRTRRVVTSQRKAATSADPVYFAPLPLDILAELTQQGLTCNTYADALEELAQRDTWVRINTYRLQEPGAPRVFEWRIVKPDGALSGQGGDPYPSFHKAMNAALRRSVGIIKEQKSKLS